MNFFSDSEHMELDFYHSMSCYLILGGGNVKLSQSSDCNWIIPDLARNVDTASAVLTKYVREGLASCSEACISANSGLYEATSLRLVKLARNNCCLFATRVVINGELLFSNTRVGAATLLTDHPTCKLENTIFRGGWEAKGFSRAFCYIGGIMNPISTAGRALAGWKDSRVRVHQPDCVSLLGQNETQIENLIVKLFHCSVTELHPRGKLWPLAKCLFATFLMHLSEMRKSIQST